jgi:hypothetical protein
MMLSLPEGVPDHASPDVPELSPPPESFPPTPAHPAASRSGSRLSAASRLRVIRVHLRHGAVLVDDPFPAVLPRTLEEKRF